MSDAIKLIARRISKEVGTSSAESRRIATKLRDLAASKGWSPVSVGFKRSGTAQNKAAGDTVRKKPHLLKLHEIAANWKANWKSRSPSKSSAASSRGVRKKRRGAMTARKRR